MHLILTAAIGFTRVLHPGGTGGTTMCAMLRGGGPTAHQKRHNCNFMGTGPHTWQQERTWDYLSCDAKLDTEVIFFEHTFSAEFPCANNVKHILLMRTKYWTWKLHFTAKMKEWQGLSLERRCDKLLSLPKFTLIMLGRYPHASASVVDLHNAITRASHVDLIVWTEKMSEMAGHITNLTGIRVPAVNARNQHHIDYMVADGCEDKFRRTRQFDLRLHAHLLAIGGRPQGLLYV